MRKVCSLLQHDTLRKNSLLVCFLLDCFPSEARGSGHPNVTAFISETWMLIVFYKVTEVSFKVGRKKRPGAIPLAFTGISFNGTTSFVGLLLHRSDLGQQV